MLLGVKDCAEVSSARALQGEGVNKPWVVRGAEVRTSMIKEAYFYLDLNVCSLRIHLYMCYILYIHYLFFKCVDIPLIGAYMSVSVWCVWRVLINYI